MSLPGARTAMAANMATITGLNTYSTVVANPQVPCVIVAPAQPFGVPETMARGIWSWHFRIIVLTGSLEDPSAQDALDAYIFSSGTNSVLAALEASRTLNSNASDCRVMEMTTYGDMTWNDIHYWGAEITVLVLATG